MPTFLQTTACSPVLLCALQATGGIRAHLHVLPEATHTDVVFGTFAAFRNDGLDLIAHPRVRARLGCMHAALMQRSHRWAGPVETILKNFLHTVTTS